MSGVKRYQNPELYERLAAEYVLGTLQGRSMRRFEQLMRERPYIQYAVDVWEQRLAESGYSCELTDVKPSAHVWSNIQDQIGADASSQKLSSRFWQTMGFWRFTTVAAVLGVLLPSLLTSIQSNDDMPMPSYVAVLESDAHTPMMVTMGDVARRTVYVRVMEMPVLEQDQDIQLWAVHDTGTAPIPIGLLNKHGMETALQLSPPQWSRVEGAGTFAISFEPKGGAPEGKPTGKMLYKGQCLDFI